MKGAGREVCRQEPLSHNPLPVNREQGLGPRPGHPHGEGAYAGRAGEREGTRRGTRGVSEAHQERKNHFQQAWLSVLPAPPLLPFLGSEKCIPLSSLGAPAPRTLPVHTGSWDQVVMTHC